MARNMVQFQKGIGEAQLHELYGTDPDARGCRSGLIPFLAVPLQFHRASR